LGISQEQLAHDSGYHPTYISQLERGLKSPSLRTLNQLAKALGISTSALVKRAEFVAEP
jgi:transcriptional regulator with XRE-family HTH domain